MTNPITPHNSAISSAVTTVRVWDLPTRVFHWALAVLVVCLVVSGLIGGNAMVWHFRFGYAVLALLLFRTVWGLVGGRWSRFGAFIYAPQRVVRYLKGQGQPEDDVGHSPLGAASVFALLGILAAQVSTGLISDDDIAFAGPLSRFVANSTVSLATSYHRDIGKWLLILLVLLHIGAILFYLRRKHNLIKPMVTGDKQLALNVAIASSRDDTTSRVLALVIAGACVGFVVWVASFGG